MNLENKRSKETHRLFRQYLALAPSCPDCESAFKAFANRLRNRYHHLRKEAAKKLKEQKLPPKVCSQCKKNAAEKDLNLLAISNEVSEWEHFQKLLQLPPAEIKRKLCSVNMDPSFSSPVSTSSRGSCFLSHKVPKRRRINFSPHQTDADQLKENNQQAAGPPLPHPILSLRAKFPRVWDAIPSEGPSLVPESSIPSWIFTSDYYRTFMKNVSELGEEKGGEILKKFSEESGLEVFKNKRN